MDFTLIELEFCIVRSLGGIVDNALAVGLILSKSGSTALDPPNPNGYVTSPAGEVKGSVGVVLAILPYLFTYG